MRRRRLIFRSAVLVLALGAAVALVVPGTPGSISAAVAFAVLAVVEAARIVTVLRDPKPDHPPLGAWWWCELPVDHRFVRLGGTQDATWRCRRCGDVRFTPPPRATTEVAVEGESGFRFFTPG
ncbi:hypothetical protein [uncultured Cellulomonas sp.]|uniref:hypothetical protein n=1 Tax=uncultured Cellulomonas sp. TaxID=189682 RepID=UPI0028E2B20B|nr:hypothetical protein [uncultured Cellulomonas sp.]